MLVRTLPIRGGGIRLPKDDDDEPTIGEQVGNEIDNIHNVATGTGKQPRWQPGGFRTKNGCGSSLLAIALGVLAGLWAMRRLGRA